VKISKELKIGLVVTGAIALFIYGFNFLKGADIFNRKHELYAVYDKVDGLIEANPLLINGYKIGQVNKISLTQKPDGQYAVLVKFLLTEDVKIPKGSTARIVSADLLGTKAVSLIYSNNTNYVEDGDTLKSDSEEDLKSAVDKRLAPLQKKAEGLISSIDSVMVVVQSVLNAKTRKNLDQSFESIKRALQSLEQTSYKLGGLVESERTRISSILSKLNTLAGTLEKNSGNIDNILKNFSTLSDSLAKSKLNDAIANADQTLKEINALAAQINSGKGTIGKLLKDDSLYINLNKSSADLDKLLIDLKEHPGRYIHISVFGKKDKSKP